MTDKNELLMAIDELGFSMGDLQLYLDTHPDDMKAIMLFNQYRQKYLVVLEEYERTYGPMTAINGVSGNTWKWVNDPWPWEYSANMEVR